MSPAFAISKTMNIIEPPAPRAQAPTRGMLLHCGAEIVSRGQLFDVPTPPGTRTWFPLSHRTILDEVESQLESTGFTILEETHDRYKRTYQRGGNAPPQRSPALPNAGHPGSGYQVWVPRGVGTARRSSRLTVSAPQ